MSQVRETKLPGIGVRHEFVTAAGEQIAVLVHHDGRRDVLVYDRDDPDACSSMMSLDRNDTRTFTELLGGSQVTEVVEHVQHDIEGLAIEWIEVLANSAAAGATIAEGAYRSRTGATIVAVIRGGSPVPAPEPDFELAVGDVVVGVGTAEGIAALYPILHPGTG